MTTAPLNEGGVRPAPPVAPDIVRAEHGMMIDMGQGDFFVSVPGNRRRQIRLRTGWPLFAIGTPAGAAPVAYIIWCLERLSTSYTCHAYRALAGFTQFLVEREGIHGFEWGLVDMPLALRYLDHARAHRRENDAILFRGYYRWACDLEYPGFDPAVADALDSLRLRGEPKGMAVLTADPETGPLPDDVFHELLRLLAGDEGPLLPRVCTGLGVEIGANPAQYVDLRAADLHRFEGEGGAVLYQLDMPRSKKSDGYQDRRRRPISNRLGHALEDYIAATAGPRAGAGAGEDYLLLAEDGRPLTADRFNDQLRLFFAASPLADRPDAHLTQRRNRYTFASRLVRQGVSIDQLVDLLDHTHAGNVMVYYAQLADVVERLDVATGTTYAAMIDRFTGRIVPSEAEAEFGDRPEQRVRASLVSGAMDIGTCARDIRDNGLCQLFPPYSCYFCPSFQAWREAPHADFAATIAEERDELVAIDGYGQGDRVIGQLTELLGQVRAVADACLATPPPPLRTGRGRTKAKK